MQKATLNNFVITWKKEKIGSIINFWLQELHKTMKLFALKLIAS